MLCTVYLIIFVYALHVLIFKPNLVTHYDTLPGKQESFGDMPKAGCCSICALGVWSRVGEAAVKRVDGRRLKHQANTVMWVKKKYSTYLGMVYISYLWWFGVCRARVFSHCTFISQKDKRRSKLLHPSPSWVLLQTAWGTDITGVFFRGFLMNGNP